jgi:hypothetical protein
MEDGTLSDTVGYPIMLPCNAHRKAQSHGD